MTGRWQQACIGLLVVAGACGCQCWCVYEPYADAVDCIADHEHHLDPLYRPWYDLTRIGRPDWCQCGLNRALCRCACERRKPVPHIIETTAPRYVPAETDPQRPVEADAERAMDDAPRDDREPQREPQSREPVPEPPYRDPQYRDPQSRAPQSREPQRNDSAPTLFRLGTD